VPQAVSAGDHARVSLQGKSNGGADKWIGNQLIDPTKGKRAVLPPQDPKGRRGLQEVLQQMHPGMPGHLLPHLAVPSCHVQRCSHQLSLLAMLAPLPPVITGCRAG
jgi:hypothetical protein